MFHRYCYGYQSLKVSRQSFCRCSFDEHSKFLWGEDTWRDLVSWPCVTWVWNFHNICGKDVWQGVPKTAALRPAVFWQSGKNRRGLSSPPPIGAKVMLQNYTDLFGFANTLNTFVLQMWLDFTLMAGKDEADPAQLQEEAGERLRCILAKYKAVTNSEQNGKNVTGTERKMAPVTPPYVLEVIWGQEGYPTVWRG